MKLMIFIDVVFGNVRQLFEVMGKLFGNFWAECDVWVLEGGQLKFPGNLHDFMILLLDYFSIGVVLS